ncbi:hypothetical protein VKT23_013397 [Stygiomarasmius scandens]|uniref:DUF6534 domain-containing protein n=1 Tax=Marasmiellus scandens TaxID=2682957 RepID=A0ABR1J6N1_9AGAR
MVYDAMVPLFVIRVLSDTVTAVALCVILFDSRTAFARSLRLIKTLMIYAMERFVLTTLVVFVQTIILIAKPKSIWAMVIEFVTAQLYTNSFLATLNSRNHLRGIGSGDSEYVSVSGFRSKIEIKRSIQISTNSTGSGVKIGTETLVMSDIVDDKRLSGWSPDV